MATPCYEGVSQTHCNILELTPLGAGQIRERVSAKEIRDEVGAILQNCAMGLEDDGSSGDFQRPIKSLGRYVLSHGT